MKPGIGALSTGLLLICLAAPTFAAITGCLSVTKDAAGVEICSECQSGFKKSADVKSCDGCPEGCRACSGTICTTCHEAYYLHTGQCHKCPTGCSSCDSQVCTSCKSEWFMTTNKLCAPCPTMCQTCKSNDRCEVCISPFILKDGSCRIPIEEASNALVWLAVIAFLVVFCPLIIFCVCCGYCMTSGNRGSESNSNPYQEMNQTRGNTYNGNNGGYGPSSNAFPNALAGAPAANFNAGYGNPQAYNKAGGFY